MVKPVPGDDAIDYWLLVAFAYSDDVRFDGVPWLPRPGHAPSSSAVPNGDEKRTTTASSCIAFTAKFGSEAYTDDARDERADDRSGVWRAFRVRAVSD